MIEIYHNPRCRKSREGLAIVESSGQDYKIIKYLENTPSKKELAIVLSSLSFSPLQLVRKNEAIWKEKFKNKALTDDQIIEAMIKYPKLIERPIVIKGNKAVIGRPAENIIELLEN
ncbi:arsenate reductase (glutaredoxin) [uncultured Eudoraea sp.]|uniref:arsenate reductase (glutaredoxin) n=1 Tax=uncultured Eudoraea sp. TaxID=1035614 RepID=UPI00261BA46B|nr:arsenate reductase (glutaredoxin) [uncultured Eudoraea sp.]